MRFRSSEKTKVKHNKKGLWSPEEDQKLRDYITHHGHGCWSSVPIYAGLQRNGKSCRLRWINYLRPGLKRGTFTSDEQEIILNLHAMIGNKWSQMAEHLPGRTDNEIKNHWHSYMKKKVAKFENLKSQAVSSDTQNKQTLNSSNSTRTESSLESSEADGCRNLPKVLFADWLTLEQFHKFDTFGSQKTVTNGALLNEASEIQEGSSYGFADSVDHQYAGSDFYDLISEDYISQNLNNSDVTLYNCDEL